MKGIKLFGFTALAALALVALVGAASASASQFRAEKYEATLHGSPVTQQVIKVGGGNLKCKSVDLSGGLVSASSALPVTPSFVGTCTYMGVKATVRPNSCQYVFNSTNESAPFTGTLDIQCSKGGDAIVIDAPGFPCKVSIPAQTGLAGVEYANSGLNANRSVAATLNVSKLKYTLDNFGCWPGEVGTHEDGSITGTFNMRATLNPESEQKVGFYLANEQVAPGQAMLRAEKFPMFAKAPKENAYLQTVGYPINGMMTVELENFPTATGSIILNPVFSGYTYFGIKVDFESNGCYFVVNLTSETTGTADIVCEGGQTMTVKAVSSNCLEKIPAQTGRNAVTLENLGTGATRTVKVSLALSGLKYTASGTECGNTGTFEDGKLTVGGSQLTGYINQWGVLGAQEGIWIE
jgi:hypothetical protein